MAQPFRGLEPHLLRSGCFHWQRRRQDSISRTYSQQKLLILPIEVDFRSKSKSKADGSLRTRDRCNQHFEGLRSLALLLPRRQVEDILLEGPGAFFGSNVWNTIVAQLYVNDV